MVSFTVHKTNARAVYKGEVEHMNEWKFIRLYIAPSTFIPLTVNYLSFRKLTLETEEDNGK